jgi:abortive infection bacteriophage resistance protein
MAKAPYSKPALSYAGQLQQIKHRGLQVGNEARALHLLEYVSYFRLSGYWYPMLAIPKENHIFKPDSTFENAFELYCFDRKFRQLVMSELEKIEVGIRAKMIYILSHANGPFWFQNAKLFKDMGRHATSMAKLTHETSRSDEEFMKSFRLKYTDPFPPSWMMFETFSFGALSSMYTNLKPGRTKRSVAGYFGLNDTTFSSWIHSLTYIRNICAHHSRLWNRTLSISPQIPIGTARTFLNNLHLPNQIPGEPPVHNNKSSYFLCSMIIYLLNTVSPNHRFRTRLSDLFIQYPMVDRFAMGFPVNWANEFLWQD